jgi:SAM-dependent methyltransferase
MTPLDYSELGLRYARGMGLGRLVAGDIRALPFPSNRFDAVVSLDVIVHLPAGEETVALAEFARVLRPGGWLALRCSALDILRSRHSLYVEERQRLNAPRLRAGVAQAGLHIERLTYANSLLLPVALFKFRVWEPLFAPHPSSGVDTPAPWLNSLLELPLRLESEWLGRGLDFPAGQSLLLLARKPS